MSDTFDNDDGRTHFVGDDCDGGHKDVAEALCQCGPSWDIGGHCAACGATAPDPQEPEGCPFCGETTPHEHQIGPAVPQEPENHAPKCRYCGRPDLIGHGCPHSPLQAEIQKATVSGVPALTGGAGGEHGMSTRPPAPALSQEPIRAKQTVAEARRLMGLAKDKITKLGTENAALRAENDALNLRNGELRAENARLLAENRAWPAKADAQVRRVHRMRCDACDEAKAENVRLRLALRTYGDHIAEDCELVSVIDAEECTCGFEEALGEDKP